MCEEINNKVNGEIDRERGLKECNRERRKCVHERDSQTGTVYGLAHVATGCISSKLKVHC